MSKTKSSNKTRASKKADNDFRRSLKVVVVIGVVLAVGLAFYLPKRLSQDRDLKQLNEVSSELREVYNKLLDINKDNVKSSDFRKDCGEVNLKMGGPIYCGPKGTIVVGEIVDKDRYLNEILDNIRAGSKFKIRDDGGSPKYQEDGGTEFLYIDFTSKRTLVDCRLRLSKQPEANIYKYSLACTKSVSDFLPGFTSID